VGAQVLVHAPGDDVGGAEGDDEAAVDRRPLPGVLDSGAVVVGRPRFEDAHGAVVQDHVADGNEIRQPLLVRSEDRDHHEEVEVSLDLAVPEVYEDRRRGQQAHRDGRGAEALGSRAPHGQQAEGGNGKPVDESVLDVVATRQAEQREGDRMGPDEPHERAVTARPHLGRKRLPTRKRRREPGEGSGQRPSGARGLGCRGHHHPIGLLFVLLE
jgi:hypothetical protein